MSHINKYALTFLVITTKQINNGICLWLIKIIFHADMQVFMAETIGNTRIFF